MILRIEMMGTKRGTFVQEFWVKCVTPVRVQVTVNFVEPTLLSYHPNVMTEFTMVDFPRTYFGTKIMKTVVLINKSPVGVMYCSKVVIKTDSVVREPFFEIKTTHAIITPITNNYVEVLA